MLLRFLLELFDLQATYSNKCMSVIKERNGYKYCKLTAAFLLSTLPLQLPDFFLCTLMAVNDMIQYYYYL